MACVRSGGYAMCRLGFTLCVLLAAMAFALPGAAAASAAPPAPQAAPEPPAQQAIQQAEPTAAAAATDDRCGWSVALSGGTALIGAAGKIVGGKYDVGAAHVEMFASSDDSLQSLAVSAGSLSSNFAPATLSHTDSVANTGSAITVTPTLNDPNTSYVLKIGGTTVSNPIDLRVGPNVIDVVVTAQDGSTSPSYGVKVTRAPLVP